MKKHFDETAALLILLRYANSAAALRQLFENFDTAEAIFSAGKSAWLANGISEKSCAQIFMHDPVRLEQDLEWCDQPHHHVIGWNSPDYPNLLKHAENPPAALFIVGNSDLLWHPQIAVVGSRHPSAGGKDNARQFAHEFAQAGWCVTSGLAEGIDTNAHRGAMEVHVDGQVGKPLP